MNFAGASSSAKGTSIEQPPPPGSEGCRSRWRCAGRAVLITACPWGLWWPQKVQLLIKNPPSSKVWQQELRQVINVAVLVLRTVCWAVVNQAAEAGRADRSTRGSGSLVQPVAFGTECTNVANLSYSELRALEAFSDNWSSPSPWLWSQLSSRLPSPELPPPARLT